MPLPTVTPTFNKMIMNTNKHFEQCRQLINELRWSERQAEQSVRLLISKALWLGQEKTDVLQLICATPSASYLQQCPHIFHQTWAAFSEANPNQYLTEFEQLLNAAN
jgi:hypothetical protein